MAWLTARFHPGFAADLTSWTTTIERKGKLIQRVERWPEGRTEELCATLSSNQVRELEMLIAAVDFTVLMDPDHDRAVVDDVAEISIAVESEGQVSRFVAPLSFWAWAQSSGRAEYLPRFDFEPALRLWETIDQLSPYRSMAR